MHVHVYEKTIVCTAAAAGESCIGYPHVHRLKITAVRSSSSAAVKGLTGVKCLSLLCVFILIEELLCEPKVPL
jgi:hypothetical protein